MDIDEQLAELLAGLGVELEGAHAPAAAADPLDDAFDMREEVEDAMEDETPAGDADASPSELCLFQTSREHYGVFYRLDLVGGAPQLRVFSPDESGAVKMRCYLVSAAADSPLRAWFAASRERGRSAAYIDARDTTQQHLLFAAGELMKRLYWTGDPEAGAYPAEISVRRLV
jgi:hypothetical protein